MNRVTFADTAATRLEAIGFRSTAPRRAVLQAIEVAPGPFTVEDLLAKRYARLRGYGAYEAA